MQTTLVFMVGVCFLIITIQAGGYSKVDGRTYYFSPPFSLDWFQATRYCHSRGMELLDIHSEAETNRINNAITEFRRSYGPGVVHFWTSGTDLGSESQFYWFSTGQTYIYTNWNATEPNNSVTSNCMFLDGKNSFKWRVGSCSTSTGFICRNTRDLPAVKDGDCSILQSEL